MPRPRLAPKMIHNTSAPTRSGVDVRRMGSSRPLALLQTTTARDTLLGADAKPYIKVQGKEAKALFASKYVPMDDGCDVLTSCPGKTISQRGYGNRVCKYPVAVPKGDRIGFNNTLVDTTSGGFKISKAGIIHHPQNAVYSDFHKGVLAGYDPASQPMWADGTYNETVAHMTKEHSGLPEEIRFLPPPNPRQDIFNIQSLAGAQIYGDALLRKEITDMFAQQRNEGIASALRREGVAENRLSEAVAVMEQYRNQVDMNRRFGLPPPPAPNVDIYRMVEEMGNMAMNAPVPQIPVAIIPPPPQLPAIEGGMAVPAPHRQGGGELAVRAPVVPEARREEGGGLLRYLGGLGRAIGGALLPNVMEARGGRAGQAIEDAPRRGGYEIVERQPRGNPGAPVQALVRYL